MRRFLLSTSLLATLAGPGLTQDPGTLPPRRARAVPNWQPPTSSAEPTGGHGARAIQAPLLWDGGEWQMVYDGPAAGDDAGYVLALDPIGNSYVAGETKSSSGSWDVLIAKFDRFGHLVWERTHAGSGGGRDYASAIALDGAGGLIVAADTFELGTGFDMSVLKYDTDGTLQWIRSYDGPAHGHDLFQGGTVLAVDGAGTSFVCGTSWGGATSYDAVTLAHAADGTPLWEQRFDGATHDFDDAYAIDLDDSGAVYVGVDTSCA
jgi:hypothetical protein